MPSAMGQFQQIIPYQELLGNYDIKTKKAIGI